VNKKKYLGSNRAYTLVEMSVVLAIASVITLLTASSFLAVRQQLSVEQATEDILNSIRETRNNSLYTKVQKDASGNSLETRAWSMRLDAEGGDYTIYNYYENDSLLDRNSAVAARKILNNSTIELTSWTGSRPISAELAFSTPFGRSYLTTGTERITWGPTSLPTKEWTVVDSDQFSDSRYYLDIKITSPRGTNSKIIRVFSSGEAKIVN
jgi:prepilin-type N-terminal cleavage/methylation domain-containing protein